VFRLLTGGTLKEALARDGSWSLSLVVRLMEEIGGALSTAHGAGVVHRDVKPSNILLDGVGHAYLSDFGIATLGIDDGHGRTTDYPSPYSPPEVSDGAAWSPRSDQYSFALVLIEVLAGSGTRSDGDHGLTGAAADLAAVIERATEADPARRFASINEMLEACRTALTPEFAPADVTVSAGRLIANPYVGLRPFDEADAPTFYARATLVAALVEQVTRDRFAAVVGASGSGKSSILHAGLLPELRRRGHPIVSMVPGTAPRDHLRFALGSVARMELAGTTSMEMVSSVSTDTSTPLILIVDQFEEVWTLNDAVARREFISDVRALVDSNANCSVVIALRADFYDRPLADLELADLIARHTFAVRPMSAIELREAIVGPAAAVGVRLEAGLDTQLVADVVEQPSSLPLLQFTLRDLFDRRRDDVITVEAYHELGGVAGAVAGRAEELYASLDADDAELARQVFLRLVVTDGGNDETGRRTRRSQLPSGAGILADLFVEHRLLTTDVDPVTREPTYELAHESLISSWPRLSAWLADGRSDRRIVQHLSVAAAAWDDRGRIDADLYRGARLDAAEKACGDAPGGVNTFEHEFLNASRTSVDLATDADDRRRRRLRRRLVATSIALVFAILASAIALAQRREARHQADAASVARLVALSQSLTASKRDVAALVALEASMRSPGAATDGAMMNALYSEPSFVGDLRPSAALRQIDVSRDGRTLWGTSSTTAEPVISIDLEARTSTPIEIPGQGDDAVALVKAVDDQRLLVVFDDGAGGDVGKRLHLVDPGSGTSLASDAVDGAIVDVQLSPGGDRAAVTTLGDSVTAASVVVLRLPELTKVAAVQQPGPIELFDGQLWFSSSAWVDDDSIAVGSTSGRIMIWRPSSDSVVRRLNDPPAPGVGQVANRLAVSPDGSTLVAADYFADGSHGNGLMAFDLNSGDARWDQPRSANPMFAIDGDRQVVYAQEAGPGSSRLFSFDLTTGQRLERILDGQHGSACSVVVTPDANRLLLASCNDTSISEWALDGATPAGPPFAGPGWSTGWNLWAFDGTRVALYDPKGNLLARDVESGEQRVAPAALDLGAWSWWLADGRMLSVRPTDDEIIVSDRDLTEIERVSAVIPDAPVGMAWTRAGDLVAVGDVYNDDIRVIETATGRERWHLATGGGEIRGLDVTPDGSRLFAGSQGEVTAVFDLVTGERIGTLEHSANVTVSPDGTLVAASAFDGTIAFYDSVSLEPVGEPITGATAFNNSIQFTFDGRLLITSGLDNTQRIWDIESRRQIGPGVPVSGWTVAIAPDSSRMAMNTADGVVLFDLDRTRLRAAICRVAARNLTDDEWRQVIGGTPRVLCPDLR
jgi:WD40 repeat protein